MVEVGVDPVKLRFHKHMVNEMIPYAVLAKLRMQKKTQMIEFIMWFYYD